MNTFAQTTEAAIPVEIKLPDAYPAAIANDTVHTDVLSYLTSRLQAGNVKRPGRLKRFARIDKMVSTWQRYSREDSQRLQKQEMTGEAQAVSINLPLLHTHLEDMTSFYANIYSPATGTFFQRPEDNATADAGKRLVDKLNGDAELSKYFKWFSRFLRTLFKYNIGGLEIMWGDKDLMMIDSVIDGVNHAIAIDMYNFLWDPSIQDPANIANEAEWAASISVCNPMYLIRREKSGMFTGVGAVIEKAGQSNRHVATYYKYPPGEAGMNMGEGMTDEESLGSVDWSSYGASLENESEIPLLGHELVKMYCWLNPSQLGLTGSSVNNDYQLWRFYIADGNRIIYARPVTWNAEEADARQKIPFYLGHLQQDEMGVNQRSTAELMAPFQTFASFLLNSHIQGTRSSIYGITGYDPSMFDLSKIAPGSTAARIPSQQPGRDVRSGLHTLNGNATNPDTMRNLSELMALVKEFFPAQALPAQVAGIERAIQSQVSAVMQGASRRMHMLVRVLDSDIMQGFTHALYENLAYNSESDYRGLTDIQARRILGSGIQQLNLEQAEMAFRQLLFAIIQNPETAAEMDVFAMISYWASLMNLNAKVDSFRKQQAPAPEAGQVPPGQPQPGAQNVV